ncbi:MAG: class I adenylate-forming enzyme family protein [Caldimonas sp.]
MTDPIAADDTGAADLPFRPIDALIREHAQATPRRAALVDSTTTLDYGALDALMDRVAASLQRDGVEPGAAIAVCALNSTRYAAIFLGALRAGVVVAPLAASVTPASFRSMVADAGAQLLFADASADAVLGDGAQLPRRIALDMRAPGDAFDGWLAPAGSTPEAVEIRPEMSFNIIYSSGTTGTPKGIVQPHGMRWTHIMRGGRFGYSRATVTLLATPLYSNTTLVVFFPTIAFGGTVVLMEKFDVDRYLALAAHHRVTHTMLVPVQYQRLMASPRFGDHDLSSFQMKFCTSAPFAAALKADVVARWPGGLVEFYGMTEGGGTCILAAHDHPTKLHTVGQPSAGHDIRLIDEAGQELPRGATGEVVGHSAGMMAGYHGQPAKTAEAEWFDADGKRFIRTGDIGRFDDEGFLTLVDRRKDMIISGGFNLYPSDLEAVLREHADIAEAAVAGVPSERWGETPAAWVVVREGAPVDAEALRTWANERVGKTQRIAFLEIVAELPRSAIGKILKRELRDRFVAAHPTVSGASHA